MLSQLLVDPTNHGRVVLLQSNDGNVGSMAKKRNVASWPCPT